MSVLGGNIPDTTSDFWLGISNYTAESAGKKSYKQLTMYAFACQLAPVSNAVVERIFSHVTFKKTNSPKHQKLNTFVNPKWLLQRLCDYQRNDDFGLILP